MQGNTVQLGMQKILHHFLAAVSSTVL
jgi:hypothetical protein